MADISTRDSRVLPSISEEEGAQRRSTAFSFFVSFSAHLTYLSALADCSLLNHSSYSQSRWGLIWHCLGWWRVMRDEMKAGYYYAVMRIINLEILGWLLKTAERNLAKAAWKKNKWHITLEFGLTRFPQNFSIWPMASHYSSKLGTWWRLAPVWP